MRFFLTIVFLGLILNCKSQYSRFLIELSDKKGSPYKLSSPEFFLSTETILRRKSFNIASDSTDLPINQSYLDSIKNSGKVEILSVSKWLNMVLVKTTDPTALNKIRQFPFVKKSSPLEIEL